MKIEKDKPFDQKSTEKKGGKQGHMHELSNLVTWINILNAAVTLPMTIVRAYRMARKVAEHFKQSNRTN